MNTLLIFVLSLSLGMSATSNMPNKHLVRPAEPAIVEVIEVPDVEPVIATSSPLSDPFDPTSIIIPPTEGDTQDCPAFVDKSCVDRPHVLGD